MLNSVEKRNIATLKMPVNAVFVKSWEGTVYNDGSCDETFQFEMKDGRFINLEVYKDGKTAAGFFFRK